MVYRLYENGHYSAPWDDEKIYGEISPHYKDYNTIIDYNSWSKLFQLSGVATGEEISHPHHACH